MNENECFLFLIWAYVYTIVTKNALKRLENAPRPSCMPVQPFNCPYSARLPVIGKYTGGDVARVFLVIGKHEMQYDQTVKNDDFITPNMKNIHQSRTVEMLENIAILGILWYHICAPEKGAAGYRPPPQIRAPAVRAACGHVNAHMGRKGKNTMKTIETTSTTSTSTSTSETTSAAPVMLPFVAVYVDGDGKTVRRASVAAETIAAAYQTAAAAHDDEQLKTVYYDDDTAEGIIRAARAVVVAQLKYSVSRVGTPLQWRLYLASRRNDDECGQDIADLRGVAVLALVSARRAGEQIEGRYKAALNAVNAYMRRDMRAVSQTKESMKTTYIEDINGDIIATNAAIKQVFEKGRAYYYSDDDERGLTDEKRAVIQAIAAACSPTQRAVVELVARGASVRQIAAIRGVSHVAVVKTLNRVRETARKLYPAIWTAYHNDAHYSRRETSDILETLFRNEF